MNIALIGYGKMGKTIEKAALKRGHHIALIIDLANKADLNEDNLKKVDVAIEFTTPHTAFENVSFCLKHQTPVVCGSTGWLDRLEEAKTIANANHSGLIVASNFSIGVNLFFELNKKLALLMQKHSEYSVAMTEIHHTAKKDAPSGTAISLAEQILESHPIKKKWVNRHSDNPEEMSIISERIDPAPGTHIVRYTSPIDDIEITHTAHNREGFAEGAVLAAEFLKGKTGFFSMKEVLGFS
jgi:4-hydroxy-tetrahydrodipicolinate reductase